MKTILLSTLLASGCLVAHEKFDAEKHLKREVEKASMPASCLEDIKIIVGIVSFICLANYLIPRPPK